MKKQKQLLLLLFLVLSCSLASAQNITVTGLVTDGATGEAMPYVTVMVMGTQTATYTNDQGRYSISAPSNGTLAFNYVGYATLEIPITGRTTIDAKLDSESTVLEDIVVIGYGSARKVGSVIGSVSRVSSEKIESRPYSSPLESLQGQVAGLQVYTSSGDPGSSQSIRLHGVGSLGASSTPLFVMDGVAVESSYILSMNPNDIENISVLKDASATSIYGSRAANGVIYVTTRRGSANDAKISVRGQYGFSDMADRTYWHNMMETQQLWDFWLETGIRSQAQITNIQNSLKNADLVQADGSFFNTKWVDYMQRKNVPTYQGDVSISGGGGRTSYFVSGSMYDETGTTPGAYYKRYNMRANIDTRVRDWFKMGTSIILSYTQNRTNPNYGGNSTRGGLAFLRPPYYSAVLKDGSEPPRAPVSNYINPYYHMDNYHDIYKNYRAHVSTYVELEPIKNFKIKSVPSVDAAVGSNSWNRNPSYIENLNNGQRGESTNYTTTFSITNTAEYSFRLNKHDFVVLAGQEGIRYDYMYYYAQSSGQTDDRLQHLNNGLQSTYGMSSNTSAYSFMSFFARADYNFDERFFLDATIRNDASSRFGKNNKHATFWSAGAMWKMKNEAFLMTNPVIDQLNLKVSYGTSGNAGIGNYASLATVAATSNYGEASSWALSSSGNPDLSWETQTKLTVGISARLWNRMSVDLEYYNRATKDMLMSVPIPATTGYTSITRNVGTLVNNGVDLTLNVDILRGRDYVLSFNTAMNYNREKITQLFDGRQRYVIPNTMVAYVVGKPVMMYMPIYAGVDPQNGKMMWYVPGDNVDETTMDPNNVTYTFDDTALEQNTGKSRYVPFTGGFGLNGTWKGIGLIADFAFVIGKNLVSNDRYFSENPVNFAGFNTSKNVLDYWKQAGDVVEYPDWRQRPVMQFDTHLLENTSFMRLKNLTLSYTLPKKLLQGSKSLKGLKVYATGRNLWLVTSKGFKGTDPEVDSNLTYGRVVNTKQIVFGLDLTF